MKECEAIRRIMWIYLEGTADETEHNAVDKHLAHCAPCGEVFEDMKKTRLMLARLEDVEPPPWFVQQLMNRINTETEKKVSLIQRLFYPLRIKIPAQALAVCCVVVLALYIYRVSEPELAVHYEPPGVVVPAPKTWEEKRDAGRSAEDQTKIQTLPSRRAVGSDRRKAAKETQRADEVPADKSVGVMAPAESGGIIPERPAEGGTREETQPKRMFSPAPAPKMEERARLKAYQAPAAPENKKLDRSAEAPAQAAPQTSAETGLQSPGKTKSANIAEKAREPAGGRGADVLAKGDKDVIPGQVVLTIFGVDPEATADRAEVVLKRFSAGDIKRSGSVVRQVIVAEVAAAKTKDLIAALKKLGEMKEPVGPAGESRPGRITIRLEIVAARP